MKKTITRSVIVFLGLLTVPFIYNSCQGSMLGGAVSSSSVTCTQALQNGQIVQIRREQRATPSPFASGKVTLRKDKFGLPGSAKAAVSANQRLVVNQGTDLAVVMDNSCLQQNAQTVEQSVITKAATRDSNPHPLLDRQAYVWKVDRDYDETEIQTLAESEPCVVGLSWNQKYTAQSFSDPEYGQQTDLAAMHAPSAYAQFYGGKAMAMTGTSIILATVDTGVNWEHPDLAANILQFNVGPGVDATTIGNSSVVYNPEDISPIGHGTNVSGIMAAVSNNGVGIVGEMPYRAKIMGVKIFYNDSTGTNTTTSQIFYNGIKFAYLNGANVINMSVGSVTSGQYTDSLAESGLQEAVAAGAVAIVVIGNNDNGDGGLVDGTTLSSIPGQYATIQGVIGVGSIDAQTSLKSYFSNYSTTYAEIGAPGAYNSSTGIFSTIPVSLGSYGRLSGTSQAAPHVSAAAGLTMGLIHEAYGIMPTPAEVERLILLSAIKNPNLTSYFKNGNQLDLLSLVNTINQQYPNTANGIHTTLPSSCN